MLFRSKAVEGHLARLALGGARVRVTVGSDAEGDVAGDAVTFLLAANPGSELAPLAKVASGGELARAMLALRLGLDITERRQIEEELQAGAAEVVEHVGGGRPAANIGNGAIGRVGGGAFPPLPRFRHSAAASRQRTHRDPAHPVPGRAGVTHAAHPESPPESLCFCQL